LKRIKIGFTESSKAVTASVDVEYTGSTDLPSNDEILKEARDLYDKAEEFSRKKTIQKL
jgi:hypothetical protein